MNTLRVKGGKGGGELLRTVESWREDLGEGGMVEIFSSFHDALQVSSTG